MPKDKKVEIPILNVSREMAPAAAFVNLMFHQMMHNREMAMHPRTIVRQIGEKDFKVVEPGIFRGMDLDCVIIDEFVSPKS